MNAPALSQTQELSPEAIERVIIKGDLKALSAPDRMKYYANMCDLVGLRVMARPFAYLELNGRLVLYMDKGGAEQLRQKHGISVNVTSREQIGDIFVVTARARLPNGREDESTGAVNIAGLKGDALANAMMKAETKAKRRVTLSIMGLGMLDESEVETISDAKRVPHEAVEALPTIEEPKEESGAGLGGDFVITFGKKFKGLKIKEAPEHEIESFIMWAEDDSAKKGKPISNQVRELKVNFERYMNEMHQPAALLDADWGDL